MFLKRGSPFTQQILLAPYIFSVVACRSLNNQQQRGREGARESMWGRTKLWLDFSKRNLANRYGNKCSLLYIYHDFVTIAFTTSWEGCWYNPCPLAQRCSHTYGQCYSALTPFDLLLQVAQAEPGCLWCGGDIKQSSKWMWGGTTVLSSPLSFQERTRVPFTTCVASLFPMDEEVKSTQKHFSALTIL